MPKNTMFVARRFVPVMVLVSTDLCDISSYCSYVSYHSSLLSFA